MALTLFTSCNALPPEGAGLAWGGPALAAVAPTLAYPVRPEPVEGCLPEGLCLARRYGLWPYGELNE
jgi:hypothetical protein